MTQAPILLVHGACHGAWCWSRIIPILQSAGRDVLAIDLPGSGDDVTPLAEVTAGAYARRVVDALNAFDTPALVVGHSMGGAPITQAAELAPERIAKLAYLCAFLPRNGQSLLELSAQADPEDSALQAVPSADGTQITFSEGSLKEAFYGDCSDDDVASAKARLRPQAMAPLSEPIHTTAERFGRVPRAYIECTEDRAIPIAQQRAMATASAPVELFSLRTSHSPFLSAPAALAEILLRL